MDVQPPWRKFPEEKPKIGQRVRVRASDRPDGIGHLDVMATWTADGWDLGGGGPEHRAAIYAWAPKQEITLSKLQEMLNNRLSQYEETKGLRFGFLSG